jgi:hypothetical protein
MKGSKPMAIIVANAATCAQVLAASAYLKPTLSQSEPYGRGCSLKNTVDPHVLLLASSNRFRSFRGRGSFSIHSHLNCPTPLLSGIKARIFATVLSHDVTVLRDTCVQFGCRLPSKYDSKTTSAINAPAEISRLMISGIQVSSTAESVVGIRDFLFDFGGAIGAFSTDWRGDVVVVDAEVDTACLGFVMLSSA